MKPATSARQTAVNPARGGTLPDPFPRKALKQLTGSLKEQTRSYRKALKRCQRKFSEKAIHASRVETRRLLASAELLGGFINPARLKKVREAISAHLDTFDELRDTQVQLPTVEKLLRQFPTARPFHDYLGDRERQLTKKTRRRVKHIPARRLGKLMSSLREEVGERFARSTGKAATTILLRSVNRAYDRTRQLRKAIDARDTATIHKTRVAFKKFRYMVETLAGHLPGIAEDYLAEMQHYQTMMGEIQDAEVLLHSFDRYLRKKELSIATAARFRAELLRRRQWLIRVYLDAAGQLLDFWPLRPRRSEAVRV